MLFLYILYNCMDRDIPAFNQLIVNKIHQKNRQLHEQRLHNIRVTLSTTLDLSKFQELYFIFNEYSSKSQSATIIIG